MVSRYVPSTFVSLLEAHRGSSSSLLPSLQRSRCSIDRSPTSSPDSVPQEVGSEHSSFEAPGLLVLRNRFRCRRSNSTCEFVSLSSFPSAQFTPLTIFLFHLLPAPGHGSLDEFPHRRHELRQRSRLLSSGSLCSNPSTLVGQACHPRLLWGRSRKSVPQGSSIRRSLGRRGRLDGLDVRFPQRCSRMD